jgi:hypothetical protein
MDEWRTLRQEWEHADVGESDLQHKVRQHQPIFLEQEEHAAQIPTSTALVSTWHGQAIQLVVEVPEGGQEAEPPSEQSVVRKEKRNRQQRQQDGLFVNCRGDRWHHGVHDMLAIRMQR